MGRTSAKTKPKLTARNADKHDLYQKSVQAPDIDARFAARYYKKLTGSTARIFREDFCGTAILACHFVSLHRENRVIGVDIDASTLEWGRAHNLSILTPDQRQRTLLIQDDVRNVRSPKADIITAMNFSYAIFKTRKELGAYVKNTYRSLSKNGVFMMDAWGGSQAQMVMEERRRLSGFTYIWDQAVFDPLSNHSVCKIHFEFRDGSRMRNAFVYDWRLWSLPEMHELMDEAGFRDVHVLWEGTHRKTGKGNGVYRRVERGGDELAWVAYMIGKK